VSQRVKELLEKASQCIGMARAIQDRYSDPTSMPSTDMERMQALTKEGIRLKNLAEVAKEQSDLESWISQPDAPHPALAADASAMSSKAGATGFGGDGASAPNAGDARSHLQSKAMTAMFAKALRKGTNALNMEEKAAIIEDTTGQIIVPHDLAGPIFLTLPRLGVLRNLALIRPTTSNLVDVRALTNATAAWGKIELGTNATAYDAAVAATGPNTITVQNLNALVQIGVDELADTDANLVSLIQGIVGQKFAEMEDDAFANGSGTSRPFGIATRATVGGAIPAAQGVTAATSAVSPDLLKQMPYLISSRFAGNGAYIASDDATQAIALLKDSTSNYLWQPSNVAGQPDRLFGYPFYRLSGLPSMATGAGFSDPAVLFGDLESGYMIADRQQITVQRLDERYADQGLVGFLFRQRVGGDVIRPAAFAKYLL
jgi:HK97 family phage major capsid protein